MRNNSIHFFYQDVQFGFQNRTIFKGFLKNLFAKEQTALQSLNVIFCTDEELLSINSRFLNHHYYTDIITFPLSQKGDPVEAELYISIDRVRENAMLNKTTIKQELHRVILHGCLHLTGYNDKSSQEIKTMREREDHYLRLYAKKKK